MPFSQNWCLISHRSKGIRQTDNYPHKDSMQWPDYLASANPDNKTNQNPTGEDIG